MPAHPTPTMAPRSISSLIRTFAPLIAPIEVRALLLCGACKYTHRPLRCIYIGNRINLEFLRSLFFAEATFEERLATLGHPVQMGKRSFMQRLPRSEIVCTDVPRFWQPFLGIDCDLRIPAWVRQEIRLEPGQELPLDRDTEKEIARHTRRHRYEIDVTQDGSAFLLFFHKYYRPYIASRFGPQAVVVSERQFLQRSRSQVLARIHSHGEWVAGMLLDCEKRHLRFGWFGAATNPPPAGASEALDAFCIRYGQERGCNRIILGNSRPNLNDGIVRYKAKFGADIVPTRFPQTMLGIRINDWTDDVVHCLTAQPLVTNVSGQCRVYRLHSDRGIPRLALEPP